MDIIGTMSLSDLMQLRTILEHNLDGLKAWRNSERGYNLDEYRRRDLIYGGHIDNQKLKVVNLQIENIVEKIFTK